jgi:hypothetical protein
LKSIRKYYFPGRSDGNRSSEAVNTASVRGNDQGMTGGQIRA